MITTRRHGPERARRISTIVGVCAALALGAAPASLAQPPSPESPGAFRVESISGREMVAQVYSPSMGRDIKVEIVRPRDSSQPSPTLYLLGDLWLDKTDVLDFSADKNVNIVIPRGGAYTYYTDWRAPDPRVGGAKWETFLTRELPPVIDGSLGATGQNAVAGISMAATSVLSLAINAPGVFQAVGSYSGCAQTSDPLGQAFVRSLVEGRGGADTNNMWGPPNDPAWAANDPYLNAEGLRGTAVFISNGSGLPGPHDTIDAQDIDGDPVKLLDRFAVGGLLEAATNVCTHRLVDRMNELDIPHEFKFRMDRTHAWAYWQDDLHDSWPLFAEALGA
ncbi:esterase family protein [Hoyosella sp. G463]|uniref:Esterase family protein n=2 Tax=Lolliginicoccus lacisalsi TaxID=2742202 RepID=A0A927PLY6_9ACTN|nr:esterase family protein [Lolliginicoccus lacisalsi]